MDAIYYRQVKTLKQALYDTIHHHPALSVEAIADQLDMATAYLYRAATLDPDTEGPNASGVRFPLKKLIPLIRVTSDFQVLDLIEFTLGRVAIPLPKPNSTKKTDIQAKALDAVCAFGDLMRQVRDSIEDGKITDEEVDRIQREGREAVQSIMVLLTQVK